MRNGRARWKSIRAMAREGEWSCRERVARRRRTFEAFQRHDVPALLAWAWRLLCDAEFALSIAQGYYDPASERTKHVRRTLAERGVEVTVADLEEYRAGTLGKMRTHCQGLHIPQEYGSMVRGLGRLGLLQGVKN